MRRASGLGPLLALLLAAACERAPDMGPGEVHWDRDACEHCSMGISDRRHAAQVRLAGARRPALFDDPGCALIWLHDQPAEAAASASIWVRSPSGDGWVDARQTRFRGGAKTPMDYGFASADGALDGGLTLEQVWTRIAEAERDRRDPRN